MCHSKTEVLNTLRFQNHFILTSCFNFLLHLKRICTNPVSLAQKNYTMSMYITEDLKTRKQMCVIKFTF